MYFTFEGSALTNLSGLQNRALNKRHLNFKTQLN